MSPFTSAFLSSGHPALVSEDDLKSSAASEDEDEDEHEDEQASEKENENEKEGGKSTAPIFTGVGSIFNPLLGSSGPEGTPIIRLGGYKDLEEKGGSEALES